MKNAHYFCLWFQMRADVTILSNNSLILLINFVPHFQVSPAFYICLNGSKSPHKTHMQAREA